MPVLPENPNLDHLHARANDLLRELQEKRPGASLADALAELARRFGFASWQDLEAQVKTLPRTADELQHNVQTGWEAFRGAVSDIPEDGFDLVTRSGWTVKGMLAHVAFWEETVAPVINSRLRGRPWAGREEWHGGDPWDPDLTFPEVNHNAHEAEWARGRSPRLVVDRLDRAHQRVLETLRDLTPEEAADLRFVRAVAVQTYLHYPEHLEEVRVTVGGGASSC